MLEDTNSLDGAQMKVTIFSLTDIYQDNDDSNILIPRPLVLKAFAFVWNYKTFKNMFDPFQFLKKHYWPERGTGTVSELQTMQVGKKPLQSLSVFACQGLSETDFYGLTELYDLFDRCRNLIDTA